VFEGGNFLQLRNRLIASIEKRHFLLFKYRCSSILRDGMVAYRFYYWP
jgi:hypothetical protein